jgi:hypothetical protein
MLAQDRLVDPEAGTGMREMLRKTATFKGGTSCAEASPEPG